MLFDKLSALEKVSNAASSKCLLGSVMKDMDRDSLEAFIRVMQNTSISAEGIQSILEEEDIHVGKTHLREKRRKCFSDKPCACIKEAVNG